MKIFYFDVETTGIDPVENDIVQLAGVIEVDGEIAEKFNFKSQPKRWDNISDEALKVTGLTIKKLKKFPHPDKLYTGLIKLLDRHCDKYDSKDKFYIGGYNVKFDFDFLTNFFLKYRNQYFGSYFNWRLIDPFPVLHFLNWTGQTKLENYKLGTVCKHYGIKINAHDALSDILATRELLYALKDRIAEIPF